MKKLLKHIIAIGILTIIIIILFEIVVMPFYVRHGKKKKLVDVTSMDIKSAIIMIKTSGFKCAVTDTIYVYSGPGQNCSKMVRKAAMSPGSSPGVHGQDHADDDAHSSTGNGL